MQCQGRNLPSFFYARELFVRRHLSIQQADNLTCQWVTSRNQKEVAGR